MNVQPDYSLYYLDDTESYMPTHSATLTAPSLDTTDASRSVKGPRTSVGDGRRSSGAASPLIINSRAGQPESTINEITWFLIVKLAYMVYRTVHKKCSIVGYIIVPIIIALSSFTR